MDNTSTLSQHIPQSATTSTHLYLVKKTLAARSSVDRALGQLSCAPLDSFPKKLRPPVWLSIW